LKTSLPDQSFLHQIDCTSWSQIPGVPKYMLNVIRSSFGVVREGWNLYNPKDFTRLNLVASGTFSGDSQER